MIESSLGGSSKWAPRALRSSGEMIRCGVTCPKWGSSSEDGKSGEGSSSSVFAFVRVKESLRGISKARRGDEEKMSSALARLRLREELSTLCIFTADAVLVADRV